MIIDEIKKNGNILRVVTDAGYNVTRENFILSPFKPEKTASCKLYPESNSFKCYATGEGGSIIDLYMAIYNVDLKTAVRELAALFGFTGEKYYHRNPTTNSKPTVKQNYVNVTDSMDEDERYIYEERSAIAGEDAGLNAVRKDRIERNSEVYEHLYRYCIGKGFDLAAMRYLKGRGLTEKTISEFRLFVINNYFEVNMHMKKEFGLKRLQQAGLFNIKEDGSGNLIFASHRIVIPYLHNGKAVYLRGRYFDKDCNYKTDGNKYLGLRNDGLGVNTPKRFFNKDIIKKTLPFEDIYLVEGEFDAMVLHQSGFNAIGVPGASNLPGTKSLLKLKYRKVIICPDNDEAGKLLKQKVIEALSGLGASIQTKTLTNHKDITDFFIAK